jgi:DNA ligase-1
LSGEFRNSPSYRLTGIGRTGSGVLQLYLQARFDDFGLLSMTRLAALVATSRELSANSSRLAKVRALAAFLRTLGPDEIETAVLYLAGETPQARSGIGPTLLQPACAGPSADEPTLQILEASRLLDEAAEARGPGSQATRTSLLRALFSRATATEREFLMRLLLGDLRQGALTGVMVDAIASASGVPLKDVRRAVMYAGNLGIVARVSLLEGSGRLDQFHLAILSPIAPMLAQTSPDVADALQQLEGEVAFDWKMDGARIQVHRSEDAIRIYTRNLNEVTTAVPEIVETIRALPVRDLILDGEAIAYNPDGRPHPFQVTMRRFGRRLAVEESRARLPLQAYFFDCLRSGGRTLVDRPARERFAAMAMALPDSLHIPRLVTRDLTDARRFYEAALAAGHEGVMAKSLDAPYEAGNRGAGWLKIKRAHTLDLVVLAAEWGHGRRTGRLSNLHLGALDPATGEYVMLGKTFKGLTDSMLEWQTREFLAREVRRDAGTVFVRPELVVEIAFSDLQASPRYPGGLALRLARVKRYREDKRATEADTMTSVRRIFESQG